MSPLLARLKLLLDEREFGDAAPSVVDDKRMSTVGYFLILGTHGCAIGGVWFQFQRRQFHAGLGLRMVTWEESLMTRLLEQVRYLRAPVS